MSKGRRSAAFRSARAEASAEISRTPIPAAAEEAEALTGAARLAYLIARHSPAVGVVRALRIATTLRDEGALAPDNLDELRVKAEAFDELAVVLQDADACRGNPVRALAQVEQIVIDVNTEIEEWSK